MKVVYYEDLENFSTSCNNRNIDKLKTFNFYKMITSDDKFNIKLDMNNEVVTQQVDNKNIIKFIDGDFYVFDMSTISIPSVISVLERIVQSGSLVMLMSNYLDFIVRGIEIPYHLGYCGMTEDEMEEYEDTHDYSFSYTNQRDYDWIDRKIGERFEWSRYKNIIGEWDDIEPKLKAYGFIKV